MAFFNASLCSSQKDKDLQVLQWVQNSTFSSDLPENNQLDRLIANLDDAHDSHSEGETDSSFDSEYTINSESSDDEDFLDATNQEAENG